MEKKRKPSDQEQDKHHSNPSKEHSSNIPIKPHQHFHLPPKPHSEHGHNKEFSPLSWQNLYEQMFYLEDGTSVFRAGSEGAVFFCIHGAGQSAMSFAFLAKEISRFGTLLCYELKGHGMSKRSGNVQDMSIGTLLNEATETLKQLLTRFPKQNFVIVGHSLGGSIGCRLTELASSQAWGKRVQGMIVIDVVEGTAIEALPFMTSILENRPKIFKSQQSAIQWSLQTNILRRPQSARVSIPPQLKQVIINGDEHSYEWKVELMATEKYWHGWFEGLSACFLRVKVPKILITAEKQRLDKQLTIAQMQGKFKLSVIHDVGHSVQQDDYKATAKLFHEFLFLFRVAQTVEEQNKKELLGLAKFHPELKPYN